MDIQEALNITGIRANELERIDSNSLQSVIINVANECKRFPHDKKLANKLEAYKIIWEGVQK